ncbi:hypothetical protein [Neomesorhizobium albiziae]|uniref:hypothetical protein n=1 Tax=Neomesorhizobium albiziae TaxID=335020 RepID=UPI00122C3D36|nr:hypothetical protein [Mesorhizobium albiziae]
MPAGKAGIARELEPFVQAAVFEAANADRLVEKKPKQNDDRDGNAEHPKQNSAKHFRLLSCLLIEEETPSVRNGSALCRLG